PTTAGGRVRRREFTSLIGGTLTWPTVARAQPEKMPIVGFLGAGIGSAIWSWTDFFVRRRRELGWSRAHCRDRTSCPVDAIYVQSDPLMNTHRVRINSLPLDAQLPTFSGIRDYVEAGSLMSYGPNFPHLYRRTAEYVDKILKGANPGQLPVEQPTTFELLINLDTAKALGITVPPALLRRADDVIEELTVCLTVVRHSSPA